MLDTKKHIAHTLIVNNDISGNNVIEIYKNLIRRPAKKNHLRFFYKLYKIKYIVLVYWQEKSNFPKYNPC